jgi:hypothetical protein
LDHLLGKFACVGKTFSEKHDFGDHCVVGDHHADWSEEGFKVVGELGSASVTWVHGDENTEISSYREQFALELNLTFLPFQPNPYRKQLLCDD